MWCVVVVFCKPRVQPAPPDQRLRLYCRFLISDLPPWWQLPILSAASLFLKTPVQGAATSIHLASSPEVQGVSSKYYADCKPQASSKASYDQDVARRLWEVSQELTGAEAAVPVLS